MMAVSEAPVEVPVELDLPSAVVARLEAFAAEVLTDAMNRPVQIVKPDFRRSQAHE